MAAEDDANPYVGPRPFQRKDAPRFFGREREVRDVVSLVIAQRVVLLYAASGAGKSSLLNAGVLPTLEDEKGVDVLPVARVRADDPGRGENVFVSALVSSLDEASAGLADLLERRPKRRAEALRTLVVDQFEELFSAHPARWRERPGLFEELRAALERDPGLRVVLAIREDFVAQLEPLAALLPGGLRTRVRLERLDRASALAAVKLPLAGTGRSFAPGAAEALVDDLLRFRVDNERGESEEVEGEYVEPVQLQVACSTLWTDLPSDVQEITPEHLRTYADVEQVLARFYDEAVAAAAGWSRRRERRIRDWVDRVLITPGGTRGAAYEAADETAGLSNDVVRVLAEKRVIRGEWRAGARWFELTHDRLIEPIRGSNQRYQARRRARLLRAGVIGLPLLALFGVALGLSLGLGLNPASTVTVMAIPPSVSISELSVEPTGTPGVIVTFRTRSSGLTRIRLAVSVVDVSTGAVRSRMSIVIPPAGVRSLRLELRQPPVGVPLTVMIDAYGPGLGQPLRSISSTHFAYASSGKPCTATGTAKGDDLRGGRRADVLCGLDGRDELIGFAGPDVLEGGPGSDELAGGPGGDTIDGGPGKDSIAGGPGSDLIHGGAGDDTIYASDGQKDVIDGGPGDDVYLVDEKDVVMNLEHQIR